MISVQQMREEIIRPALEHLSLWSLAAEQLLLGTAAAESHMGKHLRQVGGGPALGIWQMEPGTHDDNWGSYLRYRGPLADAVQQLAPSEFWSGDAIIRVRAEALVEQHRYACAMARVHYRRDKHPLPVAGDWIGMAACWKRHYNTPRGKGTVEKFMQAASSCGVVRLYQ